MPKDSKSGNKDNATPIKEFRFGDKYEGDSIVKVWCDGRNYDPQTEAYHPVYSYSISTPKWKYDANDIYGAANELPDVDLGSRSLFAFLLACAEAKNDASDNFDLFPEQVRDWANHHSDAITIEYSHITQ